MRKIWVVVANRSEMKIYLAESVNILKQIDSLSHSEGQQTTRQLVADKQGSHRGSFGTDTMEEKTPTKKKEALLFAHQIALKLEHGVQHEHVERLYIIASPKFMGELRQTLKPHIKKMIEKEVDKDMTDAKEEQIRECLPPIL